MNPKVISEALGSCSELKESTEQFRNSIDSIYDKIIEDTTRQKRKRKQTPPPLAKDPGNLELILSLASR